MTDQVAKALCEAAGRSNNGNGPICAVCECTPDGKRVCLYWETFRIEARDAILAAYHWHKKERRWPAFCK